MSNIVIHNNNIDLFLFKDRIKFNSTDNIDKYISEEIIPKLIEKEFDRIFIKDNLSANYLELTGLRLAYHIRLSDELEEKRYCPIIILSDLGSYTLNKLVPMAKILFTKNVHIISNTKNEIERFQSKLLRNMTSEEYRDKFLNTISIEPSKDSDHHSITNEWAIHQWSNAIGVSSDALDINHKKISSMLYFKYLKALHAVGGEEEEKYEIIRSQKKGKILYIDDEWSKGWSDILTSLLSQPSNITFQTFKKIDKDTDKISIIQQVRPVIEKEYPDVVILDLRLVRTDHDKKEDINDFTGIHILKIIHEINPGIQVIMMTATRQSIILEKLYDYGILGYIKKEHPDDMSISTVENIDKLFKLVEDGLSRRYLKEIWLTSQNLIERLNKDPFRQHFKYIDTDCQNLNDLDMIDHPYCEFCNVLKTEAGFVFDILNGNLNNNLNYALISLASSLDAIKNIFIVCSYDYSIRKNKCYYLGTELPEKVRSLNTYLLHIIFKMNHKNTFQKKEKQLKRLIEARNCYIHHKRKEDCKSGTFKVNSNDIKQWFELLDEIIAIIEKPKKRKRHKENSMNTLSGLEKFK